MPLILTNLSALYHVDEYDTVWVADYDFSWYYKENKKIIPERYKMLLKPNVFIKKELGIRKTRFRKNYTLTTILDDFNNKETRHVLNMAYDILKINQKLCICNAKNRFHELDIIGFLLYNIGIQEVYYYDVESKTIKHITCSPYNKYNELKPIKLPSKRKGDEESWDS